MSNKRSPYAYEPLSKNPDEITLLKLMPPSSSGDIKIEIIRVPSSAPPAYEALSYVWGSPERTHEVTVRTSSKKCLPRLSRRRRFLFGRPKFKLSHLAISRNLFIALQHLSFAKKPRLLWIDAICINQDDIVERSEQVKKMASIYGSARLVILWLGEEAHESTLAVQTLRRVGEGVDVFNLGSTSKSISAKLGSLAELLENNSEDLAQMATSWMAIEKLLERPCEQYRSPITPAKTICTSSNVLHTIQGILSRYKHAFILQY
jgi:hypothetical protein